MKNIKESKLERVVAVLSDGLSWNWTIALSRRDAADEVLGLLHEEGLIEGKVHPFGGRVWRCNGNLFGRTDGIVDFDSLADIT